MNKHLSTIGILITGIYLAALFILVQARIDSIWTMPLNELGDFFAGAFGPLAIFWLILGFFQQGIELRQNTSALELQASELKNSVEQQKELVEVSRQQFKAEIEALSYERERQHQAQQPKIIMAGVGARHAGKKSTYSINMKNVGNTAAYVKILFNQEMQSCSPNSIPTWESEKDIKLSFEYPNYKPVEGVTFSIVYTDITGIQGEFKYMLTPNQDSQHVSVEVSEIKS